MSGSAVRSVHNAQGPAPIHSNTTVHASILEPGQSISYKLATTKEHNIAPPLAHCEHDQMPHRGAQLNPSRNQNLTEVNEVKKLVRKEGLLDSELEGTRRPIMERPRMRSLKPWPMVPRAFHTAIQSHVDNSLVLSDDSHSVYWTLKACDELLGEVAEQIMGGRLRLAGGHAFQWRKYALK
ncbi:BZ3500_MvSof-1268-A1-R1_Chr5-2g07756 [Microbotryum saponariae]|uniref:BZ3500_MvSof-1268-A1-R1_Chr5-2g07756 protein n=1 Tax=Microbotryum saponariae TaxID=289078 RepID=A0A2X0KKL4_9BASI|nr:BZ3500_MvSof-1268-A1-R1_Chr5-2g07756 [Microbotryum saponariae]SDA05625.1 BZ3501_MvSof-1269-A2-R1_Chr5-2g07578 [Microbotryum saponariae]